MAPDEPRRFTIADGIRLALRLRGGGLSHEQMERQRGQRPCRNDEQMALVLDHPFDRTDEGGVKLECLCRVKLSGFARGIGRGIDEKTAPQIDHLGGERISAEGYCLPGVALPREREDIALV